MALGLTTEFASEGVLELVPFPDGVQFSNLLHELVDWLLGVVQSLSEFLNTPSTLIFEQPHHLLNELGIG